MTNNKVRAIFEIRLNGNQSSARMEIRGLKEVKEIFEPGKFDIMFQTTKLSLQKIYDLKEKIGKKIGRNGRITVEIGFPKED